jgi:hypothetical protein
MHPDTRDRIRSIFLDPRPARALMTAAIMLDMSFSDIKREVENGVIVAVSTGVGLRVPQEEMVAAAFRRWEQAAIEEALGDHAARVLPEAIRLVELRARVPRYQSDMLQYLGRRDGMSVDAILARELEGVASAYSEELASAVRGFREAMEWLG